MYNVPQIKIIRCFFYLFFIICLWSISQNILAQNHKIQDVLIFENGNKIKGRIIQQTDSTIKMRLYGGSEITYQLQDIKEITQEMFALYERKSGYFNISTINYSIRANSRSYKAFGIESVNGYRFNHGFAIGLGLGIWQTNDWGVYFPIFLSFSGDILKTKVTPIYAIESSIIRRDLYLNLSGGIKIKSKYKSSFICSLNISSDNDIFLRIGFSL